MIPDTLILAGASDANYDTDQPIADAIPLANRVEYVTCTSQNREDLN